MDADSRKREMDGREVERGREGECGREGERDRDRELQLERHRDGQIAARSLYLEAPRS